MVELFARGVTELQSVSPPGTGKIRRLFQLESHFTAWRLHGVVSGHFDLEYCIAMDGRGHEWIWRSLVTELIFI